MMKLFEIGEKVDVILPSGKYNGVIADILLNWGFRDRRETKYRVQGNNVDTITSERCLEKTNGK